MHSICLRCACVRIRRFWCQKFGQFYVCTSKKKKKKKKADRLEDDESIAMDEHEEEEQAVPQDKQEELEHDEMRVAAEEETAEDQLKQCAMHQRGMFIMNLFYLLFRFCFLFLWLQYTHVDCTCKLV